MDHRLGAADDEGLVAFEEIRDHLDDIAQLVSECPLPEPAHKEQGAWEGWIRRTVDYIQAQGGRLRTWSSAALRIPSNSRLAAKLPW